jgi:glyoxylase-like metal-dependent hydrolase (beta-lactamase superfamily II)
MATIIKKAVFATVAAVVSLGAAAAVFAPYVYVELWPYRFTYSQVNAEPVNVAKGTMFDDYFVVEELGQGAYAIGEPRYYQANYSYLIVGQYRALLFDAGSGSRDIRPVIASITSLPVTVLPSHLHFDHLGGIGGFERIAMIDLPETRANVVDGTFKPQRYEFLGMFDGRSAPAFEVAEWISPGAMIDLGGRSVKAISVPGHTPESVALFDSQGQRLFAGDFIYPTMVYAFLPGASRSAYRATAQSLLKSLPEETTIWSAHCCRRDEGFAAPWLGMGDLRALELALANIEGGEDGAEGFFPRSHLVNDQMVLGTSFPWNNR